MSNEFTALRELARERRDREISAIREQYEQTLLQIATLEQDLLGKQSSKHKTISSCIESVIPREEPFSTVSVLAGLEALDPGRVWRKRSIDHHFTRLRERNIIKRIRRATIHEPALYVRVGASVAPPTPLADATLADVIRMVLTRPMTTTEVMVAVVEAGYRSSMPKTQLRSHVGRELRAGPWQRDGGKWTRSG
jgi:hypothetical protein